MPPLRTSCLLRARAGGAGALRTDRYRGEEETSVSVHGGFGFTSILICSAPALTDTAFIWI